MGGIKDSLTPEKMIELLSSHRMNLSKIAKQYKVSRQRIWQIFQDYKANYPELFSNIRREPNKEEIEELLAKHVPLFKIAEKFRISGTHLKKIMDRYGLKKMYIKDILTPECLRHLYVDLEKSDSEIAQLYGCSRNTVMKLRYEYGIYKAMRKPLVAKITKELFNELYVDKGLTLSQIADLFGCNIQTVAKLKKFYQIKKRRRRGVSAEKYAAIKKSLIERGVIFCA